jgi:hypothetical protein
MSEDAAAACRAEELAAFPATRLEAAGLDRGKAHRVGSMLSEGPRVGHPADATVRPEPRA